jgi:FkbM family methyltransferase
MNPDKELYRLTFAKLALQLLPAKLRRRAARKLYNNLSDNIRGIDIVVNQPGYKLLVNTKDLIGWNVFFFSGYEQNTNNILQQYIRPGDTVVEAGANIGTETILLANLVGDTGKVYAFEPNRNVFNRLSYNANILNQKTNVVCFDQALGEKNDIIRFHIYPESFPNSGMSSKYHPSPDVVDVRQVTLDSLLKDSTLTRVDFIKMDVQGAELDVLLGATETLSRFKPYVFLEAHEHQNELFKTLVTAGYRVHTVTDKGLVPIGEPTGATQDWLAIHQDKLNNPKSGGV